MGSLPRAGGRVGVPGAAGAKKIVRLASVFPSPPFGLPTSQGRGGLGSMDSTLALGAFRIARDAGGEAVREREPRRAGEGRCLELNSCFLIDYRLWAAKSEGRHGSSSASSSASSIPLNLGVGCAPSCWPIFGFRTSWVLAGGAEGSFLCSLSSRFSGGGGGVGSPPRPWRRVGGPGGNRPGKGLGGVSVGADGKSGFGFSHC